MGQFCVHTHRDGRFKMGEMTPNSLGVGRRFLLSDGGVKDQQTVNAPIVVQVVNGPIHFVCDGLNDMFGQRKGEKGTIGSCVASVSVGSVGGQG